MSEAQRYPHLLPAVPPDGLGVPGQLPDHERGGRLGRSREHSVLRLSPSLLGGPACRQDVQALSEHLPHHWRHLHERMS